MLRTLLKFIILKSTRIWKRQHQLANSSQQADVRFLRKFGKLVEQHYKTHHRISDYAELLQNGKIIVYPGFSHGMPTIEAGTINKDILDFINA